MTAPRFLALGVTALALAAPGGRAWAIGEIALGAHVGLMSNPNNVLHGDPLDAGSVAVRQSSDRIARANSINRLIATGSGKGEQFSHPLAVPFGLQLKYNVNAFLIRAELDHARLVSGSGATLTPKGGKTDVVSLDSNLTTVPISVGAQFALTDRHRFYFGVGPVYAYSQVAIEHSRPGELAKLLPSAQQGDAYRYFGYSNHQFGFHYLIGMDIPIAKRISLSADMIGLIGRGAPSRAAYRREKGDQLRYESRGQSVDIRGFRFSFGLNYIVKL